MQLSRRGVLGLLSAAALDPERLLWLPGKLISIPKPRVFELYSVESGVLRYILGKPVRCSEVRLEYDAGTGVVNVLADSKRVGFFLAPDPCPDSASVWADVPLVSLLNGSARAA